MRGRRLVTVASVKEIVGSGSVYRITTIHGIVAVGIISKISALDNLYIVNQEDPEDIIQVIPASYVRDFKLINQGE